MQLVEYGGSGAKNILQSTKFFECGISLQKERVSVDTKDLLTSLVGVLTNLTMLSVSALAGVYRILPCIIGFMKFQVSLPWFVEVTSKYKRLQYLAMRESERKRERVV